MQEPCVRSRVCCADQRALATAEHGAVLRGALQAGGSQYGPCGEAAAQGHETTKEGRGMTDIEKRELLVRLAVNVMNWTAKEERNGTAYIDAAGRERFYVWEDGGIDPNWWPLGSINDAWMLVEALANRGLDVLVQMCDGKAHCSIHRAIPSGYTLVRAESAETAPLAISLAADQATREPRT